MTPNIKTILRDRGLRATDIAAALDINKSCITRWAQRGIPALRAIDVERLTGIPRGEMRPDLWPKP